jgi:hypothetical protein
VVRLTVDLVPSAGAGSQILLALRFLMVETRLHESCRECSAWAALDGTIRYVEEWADETSMLDRVRSGPFTSLLAVMEAAAEPPRVQFEFIARTRGLDYIADARGCSDP